MKSQSTMTAPVLGILAGVVFLQFEPLPGYLLLGISGLSLFMEFRKSSSMRTLFRNLGLYNKDEMYPAQRGRKITQDRTTYRFSLPPGLGLEDFEKHKNRMQDYLGKRVNISCQSKSIILEVFKQ